jgi:uncharacterized protein YggL (DUF469 family)
LEEETRMKKQIGLHLMYTIFHKNEEIDLTEEDMDAFLDDLIDLVEKRGWIMGGGIKFVDEDGGMEELKRFILPAEDEDEED